jgi:transcriptional regulator with XRE-family HTH domain
MAKKASGGERKGVRGLDGTRIAEAREALGWSQWELANRAQIHPQRISQLERNYARAAETISISKALDIADALGRSLTWLCRRE